ncbi:uncharacterized protein LOC118742762 [Rhagoletis pomonella]|uniref:uncharacterized protein LOC118742762 n=1 Tax=Rhagoletis pomonella TaxID=28610 RepID=UPI00177D93D2|nr:uncharacterized protein LOC118742762 [Rhagoletis pomonella]
MLRLRPIKNGQVGNVPQTQLAICLDLVTFNISSNFGKNDAHLLEFFLHHYVLGINQFIVYNGDDLSENLLRELRRHKDLHVQSLPFNFPFTSKNSTSNIRDIIKTDCLLRSIHRAKFAILLEPNEFFFPNAKINVDNSVLNSLHSYGADSNAFELQTYSVCIDQKNKLLTNNSFYDPEVAKPHTIYIYKPRVPMTATTTSAGPISTSANLAPSLAFAHRYIDCANIGKDGLHSWHNALRQNFMNNINNIRLEVMKLMYT